jgi:hypothetical protein
MFSDDKALQDRLVAALLRKGGTLLISHISMAELGGASDPKHVIDAEKFFERCLPHRFLTDFRLDEVLAREQNEPSNATRFWPTEPSRNSAPSAAADVSSNSAARTPVVT